MLRSLALPLLSRLRTDGLVFLIGGDEALLFSVDTLTFGLLALLLLGFLGLDGIIPFSFGFAGLALGDATLPRGFVCLNHRILPFSVGLLARDQRKNKQQRQDADGSGETNKDHSESSVAPLAITLLDFITAYVIDMSQDGVPGIRIWLSIDFVFLAVEPKEVCGQWHLHQFAQRSWKGHAFGLLGAGFVVGNARMENRDNILGSV